MHEMSLTEGILRVLEQQAAAQGFTRVVKVRLEIGELSAVDPESLRFCFEAIRDETVADGAELEIIPLPGRAFCVDCGKEVPLPHRFAVCPDCGGGKLQLSGGDEMRIKDLEVE
ncbi:MAG: hydrogenase maturation nickel metallochaperone HypA [Telmatospirillum sp.]|nr:hydrogenase maturation nickel metallochaperone HypA [Telmatospirillum sp.]